MPRRRPNLKEILATNIRGFRAARDWTQDDLATRSGISQYYISQLESAGRNVSIEVLERLAAAFKVEGFLLLKP
jgi:transcriptional regulator with XRE-family HTH domain